MTNEQFNQSVNADIKRMLNKAQEPTSFSEWLDHDQINRGHWRQLDARPVQANHDIYKNGNPFQ